VPASVPNKKALLKAAWVVCSSLQEDFGDIFWAEFQVLGDESSEDGDHSESSCGSESSYGDWILADSLDVKVMSDTNSGRSSPRKADADNVDQELVSLKRSVLLSATKHDLFDECEVSHEKWCCYPEDEVAVSLGCLRNGPGGAIWCMSLELQNNGTQAWDGTEIRCCYGSGFGCPTMKIPSVEAGESVVIKMPLTIPIGCEQTAWVMCEGEEVFGPAMVLRAIDY